MKFSIDVDLPEEVLREYEPVACRVPACGETFVTQDGNTYVMPHADTVVVKQRIILRSRFRFPEWLTCRYLVWDADGTVSGWDEIPSRNDIEWHDDDEVGPPLIYFQTIAEIAEALGIAFPGGDWQTRIEENPNLKAGA